MKIFKKMTIITCLLAIILIMFCSPVSADQGQWKLGDQLTMNSDQGQFNDLAFVSDGKLYIPLRLMFPISNDKDNQVGMSIAWSTEYNTVRIIHGETTGEGLVDGAPPFVGKRTCIEILLTGDFNEGATGGVTYLEYQDKEDLYTGKGVYMEQPDLNDPVYVKNVEGGSRVFVSVEDMMTISELLGLNNDYSVKLYNYKQ